MACSVRQPTAPRSALQSSEESSEYTTDEGSDDERGPVMLKPAFVPKTEREVSPTDGSLDFERLTKLLGIDFACVGRNLADIAIPFTALVCVPYLFVVATFLHAAKRATHSCIPRPSP